MNDTPPLLNTTMAFDPSKAMIHNVEIEKSILASLMTSNQALIDTNDILDSDCFYDSKNREIYDAIQSVYKNGDFPDMMLVSSELGKRGSSINALEVTELCFNSTQLFDVVPHASILKDYSLRRKLCLTGLKMISEASTESTKIETIHIEAKEAIDSLFESQNTKLSTLESSFVRLQEHILKNRDLEYGETFGTPTGFPYIDKAGGLCGGDLIIVGAETSQGKTSFATALSLSAIEHGDGVAFYSLEMTSLQLTARIASMRSGISSSRIMYEKLSMEEVFEIGKCMDSIDCSKMYFDEKSTSSLDSVLMSIRSMKMKHGIKGAVVDYLQLVNIKDSKSNLNKEQATAKCARDLKNLAKELDIWIISISQLSRNAQNPIPSMARLRDSGQIEEAADRVYLIYRPRDGKHKYPEPFENVTTEGTAMIFADKGRHTGTGQFICGFKPENTLFYPLDEQEISNLTGQGAIFESHTSKTEDELPF